VNFSEKGKQHRPWWKVFLHLLEHWQLGARSCIEWPHWLWHKSGLLWWCALSNVITRPACSKWKICWQSKC
jgi:hypothetical protein